MYLSWKIKLYTGSTSAPLPHQDDTQTQILDRRSEFARPAAKQVRRRSEMTATAERLALLGDRRPSKEFSSLVVSPVRGDSLENKP
jgi:hypothetical protein